MTHDFKERRHVPPTLRNNATMQRFIGAVTSRKNMRQKALWTRFIGAGFTADDIEQVWPEANLEYFGIKYAGDIHSMRLSDLNLRELDELEKWLLETWGEDTPT